MKHLRAILAAGFAALIVHESFSASTVYKDLFVIRTGNAVFSLKDLERFKTYVEDFECFYPEALVSEHFSNIKNAPANYFKPDSFKAKNDTQAFKALTERFVSLFKMIRYAGSQAVSVSSDLPKAFKLSAEKSGCSMRGFSGVDFKEEMGKLALLEVFLRSRFLPNSEIIDSKKKQEILNSLSSLEASINNQIDHELFKN